LKPFLKAVLGDSSGQLKTKILCLYGALILFNVGVWTWAFMAFRDYPLLMGTSLLAYSLGLRHAVDADHIAAIDNVTRKLMQAGKRPISVGLMFSLGHSTIVVLASTGIAVTALATQGSLAEFKAVGGLVGTLVSTLFLIAIGMINLVILWSAIKTFQRVRRGEPYVEEDFDLLMSGRGMLSRLFRPLFGLISKSWHMYFLGFLFGLGFDTATEIGLLGIAAAGAAQGMPIWSILVFPMLFMAGMTLIDTTDSILMLGAYGWAFVKPIRKLYYNITITAVSVIVALSVGGIEGLGLLADQLGWGGGLWDVVGSLNDHFGLIGYGIVGVFVLSWLISVGVYRFKRYEDVEVTLETGPR